MIWKDAKKGNLLLPKEFINDRFLRNLCLQVFFLGAFYNVCLAYLPTLMQFSMGLSADTSGNLLAIFVVLMGIGSVLGGIAKISTRLAILIGWFTCLAGSIMMQILFTLSIGMLGFGSGILMSVLLGCTASRTQGHAAGVNSTAHLVRNFGGSIGTILFQFSLNYPQQYYMWGVFILALSGTLTVALSFRFELIINNNQL